MSERIYFVRPWEHNGVTYQAGQYYLPSDDVAEDALSSDAAVREGNEPTEPVFDEAAQNAERNRRRRAEQLEISKASTAEEAGALAAANKARRAHQLSARLEAEQAARLSPSELARRRAGWRAELDQADSSPETERDDG